MFSPKDREVMLNVRSYFENDCGLPDYLDDINAIIVEREGVHEDHLFFVACCRNNLTIITVRGVKIKNCSVDFLKFVLAFNMGIPSGHFCYVPRDNKLIYKLSVPLFELPSKKMVVSLINSARDDLDAFLPEIFLEMEKINLGLKNPENPKYH